ncbi:MAG TPA: hypothetical protein VKJ65_04240, partial [Phycisphaerae bacterium]|nr:hypothetical protein [Phycisphaerae bacterium]
MKNKRNKQKIIAITGASLLAATCAHAQIIVDWDVDSLATGVLNNSPTPSFGSGTATVLGMNNSYNSTTSLATADIIATAGASTGSGSSGWRVRGGGGTFATAGSPNGWSTQAPLATQGAEFATSTASDIDDNNINVSFDLYTTGQAEANLAVEYTLDDTQANPVWQLATITSAGNNGIFQTGTDVNTVAGNYVQLTQQKGWDNQIIASIAGAGGDANFAVEIVNASTGADCLSVSGSLYNNSSGNWRYDNVEISAVPEPSTVALAGCGFAALIGFLRL